VLLPKGGDGGGKVLPLGQVQGKKSQVFGDHVFYLEPDKGATLFQPHPLLWEGAILSKHSFIFGLGEVKRVKVEVMSTLG